MKLDVLQRLGGVSTIAGSVLLAAWAVCWPALFPIRKMAKDPSHMIMSPNWIWPITLLLAAMLLLIFGFMAVYSRMYRNAGIMGFVGYVFIITAYIFHVAQLSWEVFLYPILVRHTPSVVLFRDRILDHDPLILAFHVLQGAAILVGVGLFSIALIRFSNFPRSSGILILIGTLLYGAGPILNFYLEFLGLLVLSAGFAVLGIRLVRPRVPPEGTAASPVG